MPKGEKEVLHEFRHRLEHDEERLSRFNGSVHGVLEVGNSHKVTRYVDENGEVTRVTMSNSTGVMRHNPMAFGKDYINWTVGFTSIWRGRHGAVYRTGNMSRYGASEKKIFTELLDDKNLSVLREQLKLLEDMAHHSPKDERTLVFLREVTAAFTEAPSFGDLFPLSHHYKVRGLAEIPLGIRGALRGAENMQQFTRSAFGVTRYRRDLVKAVANAHPFDVENAWQLRGLVPVDWIVDLLRGRSEMKVSNHVDLPRHHLRHLDQRSLRRLVRELKVTRYDYGFVQMIKDIAKVTTEYPTLTRVDSWRDLHDRLVALERPRIVRAAELKKVKSERMVKAMEFWELQAGLLSDENWCLENPELAASPELRKQHRAELEAEAARARQAMWARQEQERIVREAERQRRLEEQNREAMEKRKVIVSSLEGKDGDIKVTVAKKGDVLLEWGNEMSNCIASYRHEVNSPRKILGGIYQGKQLLGNFEVSYSQDEFILRQLLGKYNHALEKELRERLVQRFSTAGVVTDKGYWGEN